MVIIMPNKFDGLKKVEQNIAKFTKNYLNKSGSMYEIDLSIPKFKIKSSIDLKGPLKKVFDNQYYIIFLLIIKIIYLFL